jgi:two-component system, OmpR family, sensor histidine kinase QseC
VKLPSLGSIRVRLVALILAVTTGILVAAGVVVYLEADHESEELFDLSLQETGHLLFTLAEHEAIEIEAAGTSHLIPMISDHQPYLFFQIWTTDGRLLYRNNGSPAKPFVSGGKTGLGWFEHNGEKWRTFALWNQAHTMHMQVGEPTSHRKEISSRFAIQLSILAAIILPLLGGLIWWIVHRTFAPLRRSTRDVASRVPGDLREVDVTGADEEVKPLFGALNQLFARVRRTLEREQRFTANAAHELRTPLAGIKTNLQVLTRARDGLERNIAQSGLAESTERAIRLVDQLLTLARVDPDHVTSGASVDLPHLIDRAVNEHAATAGAKLIGLSAECEPVTVFGAEAGIAILLRNLIDNAIRYTPIGGRVIVSCRGTANQVTLCVRDSGPGIAMELRDRIFDRFYRVAGSQATGSGLGLSIVKGIAELHLAAISVTDGIGTSGTTITVTFPVTARRGLAAHNSGDAE